MAIKKTSCVTSESSSLKCRSDLWLRKLPRIWIIFLFFIAFYMYVDDVVTRRRQVGAADRHLPYGNNVDLCFRLVEFYGFIVRSIVVVVLRCSGLVSMWGCWFLGCLLKNWSIGYRIRGQLIFFNVKFKCMVKARRVWVKVMVILLWKG